MRISNIVAGLLTAALCAAAFGADGSDLGGLIVSSIIVGLAVFFHARTVEGGLIKASIAAVYLAAFALGSITARLIDKALGSADSASLLDSSSAVSAVILGWAICTGFLQRGQAQR
jgi:hypothetical protein